MYPDTKYLTGLERERLLKEFKQVIDKRDSSIIKKSLYNFLHVHMGFIAHFNIHGFRETYSESGFREFVEHFDQLHPNNCYPWLLNRNSEYYKLIKDMAEYVTLNAPNIYSELDDKKRNSEVALAKRLLKKHGLIVFADEKTGEQESLFDFIPEENGQMAIGF